MNTTTPLNTKQNPLQKARVTEWFKRKHRPKIGITMSQKGSTLPYLFISLGLRLSGARAIPLTNGTEQTASDLDGLVVSGGIDIEPSLYGQPHKTDYRYEPERDQLEQELIRQMELARKPILGICRGAQMLNIVRGGSLYMDVRKAFERAEYPTHLLAKILYRKPVNTKEDSAIRDILGCKRCKVNSMHTQAIDTLGAHLSITSQEDNGIVQSVEDPSYPFFLGVQFHPEYLLHQKRFRNIFKELTIETAGTTSVQ
jgi:putative glutamine amidotransferase